jgi:formylglycine-generating enzyme required for sulfatase activity
MGKITDISLVFFALAPLIFVVCTKNPASREKPNFSLSITIDGPGTVAGSPLISNVKGDSTLSLLALADSGSTFLCWQGDIRSNANPLTFVVTHNITVRCMFVKRPAGMQKIASSGKSFIMGSTSAASALVERPPHPVRFTYDYFIDEFEATQGEYERLMGNNPARDHASQSGVGVGDSLPVTYVRWYDAALFCNAKSKRDGFDTVYSFTAKCPSEQTCPYVLENLAIHYDRLGYRLLTEAEWEYACRAGSTEDFHWGAEGDRVDSFAWCFQNSQNMIHPVGRKNPNGFGLFDMAGNVAEWVNDWRGAYSDSLGVNPIGPTGQPLETFESSWERPLRGGCYSLGTSFLRSSNRSSPYAVAASTRNGYTGFRMALGVFFPDTLARLPTTGTDSASVNLDCLKSDVLAFVGTSRIKIAFAQNCINGKNRLAYIDFTNPGLAIACINDSLPISKPALSPNGMYVTYGSKGPGFTGSSEATIRRLDNAVTSFVRSTSSSSMFLPHWSVDTASLDTFIIFTDGASMNDLARWKTEKTYRQKIVAGVFSGAMETVCGKGSFHGGMSRDGQFVATGYPHAYVYHTATNRIIQYFIPPWNGKTDTGQVCNVSITPGLDRPDEIMFLDFGYSKPSSIVGKPYGFHSIIYIANSSWESNYTVRKWFEVPDGYTSWNGAQWSNHPDFAIALAQSSDSESVGSVFLIDIKNSRFLRIAHGQGLSDPSLWIDPASLSEKPDPNVDFGKYNVPSNNSAQYTLDIDLKYYWARRDSVECAFVGSSHVMMGVDPSCVKCLRTVQVGVPNLDFILERTLINNYFRRLSPSLKVIGMSCDPGWLDMDYADADPHGNGFVYSKGFSFDKSHDFWKDGVPSAIEAKVRGYNALTWPDVNDTTGAFNGLPIGEGWGEAKYDGGDYLLSAPHPQEYLVLFKNLVDSIAAEGRHVLLVRFPEHPGYKDAGIASRYGPRIATYNDLVAWYRRLEQDNPRFHFYDANMNGDHDYTTGEALDCDHLNCLGRHKFSVRLDSVLTTIIR